MEPFHHQSYLQSSILDDGYGVLVSGILEICLVHRQNSVAYLQHVATLSRTGRNNILDKHSGYLAVASDVHLKE